MYRDEEHAGWKKRQTVVIAFYRLTCQVVFGDDSLEEAMNRLSEDDQIKMIVATEHSLSFIEDPTDEMKRIHELKWKL
ncbi:MAG: hypothetical protein KAJ33_05955 [Thermoplasmata archaeon]|nr:hypothetical protein [Thermoplasmata archaeon]